MSKWVYGGSIYKKPLYYSLLSSGYVIISNLWVNCWARTQTIVHEFACAIYLVNMMLSKANRWFIRFFLNVRDSVERQSDESYVDFINDVVKTASGISLRMIQRFVS